MSKRLRMPVLAAHRLLDLTFTAATDNFGAVSSS